VVFAVWVILINLPIAYLTANHLVPVPPSSNHNLPTSPAAGPEWKAVHLLAADCGCSLSVARHLQSRGPQEGLAETIVLIGDVPDLRAVLGKARFEVKPAEAANVERDYGVVGGPWLLLFRPDGSLAYSGGYAPVRARDGVAFQDIAIWERIRHGQSVAALPAFGCATSEQLRQVLDPLHLKYTR
jgi:hypothetical protein